MSLRTLFQFGKRLLKGKKESATPATGQQQKQITYEPKPSQAQGTELALREIRNPPVVLKQTKPLQMGDDISPAFGSSTYDWVMRKGRGKYTADEWIDHLTSRRKEKFNIFGKPATRTVLDTKKFKYDRGPFAGKEVNISKEELFDSNLAIFNSKGDLTGGLLFAAQKFGLKLDANEVGAMLKLNPVNRLKTMNFGLPAGLEKKINLTADTNIKIIESLSKKYRTINNEVAEELQDAKYYLNNFSKPGSDDVAMLSNDTISRLKRARDKLDINEINDRKIINKMIGEISEVTAPLKSASKPKYYNNEQTLMGGDNYREVVFYLDEPIKGNSQVLKSGGSHYSDFVKNEIFHVRFDTRFTPDGKKVLSIHQIQADNAKSVAKNLNRMKQFDGINRKNPFQKDIENRMFLEAQSKLQNQLAKISTSGNASNIYKAADDLQRNTKRLTEQVSRGKYDYFPMPEAADYNDHALKYLLQLASREGADYVAVLPFDMLNYKASSRIKGNEYSYGYSSGRGINKKGKAIIPELMKRSARFFNSSAGPIKISRSNPKRPYKKIETDKYTYPEDSALKGKSFTRISHSDAVLNPKKGYKLITEDNPNLYFDAFAIKVNNLMRGTQKTYKSKGGLVVDMFKTMRYN
jgi:hypothetical protein